MLLHSRKSRIWKFTMQLFMSTSLNPFGQIVAEKEINMFELTHSIPFTKWRDNPSEKMCVWNFWESHHHAPHDHVRFLLLLDAWNMKITYIWLTWTGCTTNLVSCTSGYRSWLVGLPWKERYHTQTSENTEHDTTYQVMLDMIMLYPSIIGWFSGTRTDRHEYSAFTIKRNARL